MSKLSSWWGNWKCKHGWHPFSRDYPYECRRCDRIPKRCRNCGDVHSPYITTLCTVARRRP